MKKIEMVLVALCLWVIGVAHAMEGEFDRSAEVDRYVAALKTDSKGTLASAAKEISVSGIADPRLAGAVNERLLADYKIIGSDRENDVYGVWMCRALASFGIAEYGNSLKTVVSGTRNSKVGIACKDAQGTIAWNHVKNRIMASRQYHSEGDDPAVSRLMNLLMADDYAYKRYAAERMNWERVLDKRLMAAIAPQVEHYVQHNDRKLTNLEDDTIANFVKLLGYSRDVQYRAVLEQVLADPQASASIKRHAKAALDKLF